MIRAVLGTLVIMMLLAGSTGCSGGKPKAAAVPTGQYDVPKEQPINAGMPQPKVDGKDVKPEKK